MEIDISKLEIGQRVHYLPLNECDESLIENGMVKEIPEHTNTAVRVVFNCAGEWDDFMNYTSQLTDISQLKIGWFHSTANDSEIDSEDKD